jgi:hypothetical protein
MAKPKGPHGGGDADGTKPPSSDGDGFGTDPTHPQHVKGGTKAETVSGGLDIADAEGALGRPGNQQSGTQQPGTQAPAGGWVDPAGGNVTYGPTEMAHWRSHAQDIREVARAEGVDIPRSPGRPETQAALRAYIESIVRNPDRTGVGQYKTYENAIWTARGDLVVVRTSDGQFITALRDSRGRATSNAPWKTEGTTDAGG